LLRHTSKGAGSEGGVSEEEESEETDSEDGDDDDDESEGSEEDSEEDSEEEADDDEIDAMEDDEDDLLSQISAADSDMDHLELDIRRQDREQYAFASSQHLAATGRTLPKPATAPRAHRAVHRGPRKPAPPSTEIMYRLSKAQEAYEQDDHELAIAISEEIIRINAQTYQAWEIMLKVYEDRNDRKNAIVARVHAAQIMHRNVPNWLSTAAYVMDGLDELDDEEEKKRAYEIASACYSQILSVDRSHVAARMAKADVLMALGKASLALQQYERLLLYRPLNIQTVRNLASVALDSKNPQKAGRVAKEAYRTIIDHCQKNNTREAESGMFDWSDLRIYLEFFSILELWEDGARELKSISRWLLGRHSQVYWDRFTADDREWDIHDSNRVEISEFLPNQFPQEAYGLGLPLDLRAKLYVYRLKLDQQHAALSHAGFVDPQDETAVENLQDFPDCLREIGNALLEKERAPEALPFFQAYVRIAGDNEDVLVDADFLVAQARCHLALGNMIAAEEFFIEAIENDNRHIVARVELAKMYEVEEEKEGQEEALLLVTEAMDLEARQVANEDEAANRKKRQRKRKVASLLPRRKKPRRNNQGTPAPPEKKRYYPRRLIDAEQKRQKELEAAAEVGRKYVEMERLRTRMADGDEGAVSVWMRTAKELTDDFRSFKQFYPWDKYIKNLGYAKATGALGFSSRTSGLAAMAMRLQQSEFLSFCFLLLFFSFVSSFFFGFPVIPLVLLMLPVVIFYSSPCYLSDCGP
jgi:general transcription factor 3C polypeptide 3 (transcription factor C subunit 4)